jgi:hypothetical protein
MISRQALLLIGLGLLLLTASLAVSAQDPPNAEQQQKAQAALQEKAFQLLDQVVAEARALKLPENRLRVQWQAGDLLWPRDEARARALFSQAAAGIGELIQGLDVNDRRYMELLQTPAQLRQEFLTTVARRDPKLAYNLLLATRPPVAPNANNPGQQNMESSLEMNLLAQVAGSDPRLALQNAEAALDKGQFSSSLARLLAQLQEKDKEAAAKLKDKLLKKLRGETLLSAAGASSLALSLLRPGPRLSDAKESSTQPQANSNSSFRTSGQALDEAAYRELLELVIAAALSATPRNPGPPTPLPPGAPSALRNEQANVRAMQDNARNLAMGLQSLLPQIEKYLPARAPAIRQKLTEMGARQGSLVMTPEIANLLEHGSAESLMQAASSASSPEMQSWLYRQAASKALSEGNLDRARQIATQHVDERQRENIMRELERQQTLQSALAGKLEETRQTLAALKTDAERVNWLVQAAATVSKKNDQKLALQFLDEARALVSRRAENYQQFDTQLRVARGYSEVDAARAVEVLMPGIEQLNDLLAAAAVLSGFEIRVFKEGEMLLQGGGQLNSVVARYGQTLAGLARSDFERAQTALERFQRAEPRLIARLAIVRGLLDTRSEGEMPMFNPPPPPPPAPIR